MKIEFYENGYHFFKKGGSSIGIYSGKLLKTVDLTSATDKEIAVLRSNPNDSIINKFPLIKQQSIDKQI